MLTRNVIRNKNLNPDKDNNRHPDDSLNVLNTSSENSTSVIITSPPTKYHHNEYEKQSLLTHQTETVISNSFLYPYTENMSTDIKLNSKATRFKRFEERHSNING